MVAVPVNVLAPRNSSWPYFKFREPEPENIPVVNELPVRLRFNVVPAPIEISPATDPVEPALPNWSVPAVTVV